MAEKKLLLPRSTKYLAFIALVISFISIAYLLEINSFRNEILNMPDAEEPIPCPDKNNLMKKKDCFLRVGIPSQNNAVTSFLILQNDKSLIFFVYIFSGILGSAIYYIVLLYKPGYLGIPNKKLMDEFSINNFFLRILISGISGAIVFLIILAVSSGLGTLLPSLNEIKSNQNSENYIVIPVLTGLFLSIFFQGARSIIKRFFSAS